MICLLHGYLLEGSGSNLWTRLIVEALCRQGHDVHVMCQENHPDRYPFIRESRIYRRGAPMASTQFPSSGHSYPGGCTLHKPLLGDTLPVFVWDRYEEFSRVVPMIELTDDEIEDYVAWNARVLLRIVQENGITAIHANHSVLMPQVAMRVSAETGVPFTIMPHGSGLEYAVKRDHRFLEYAEAAFAITPKIFVHGSEMRARVKAALPGVADLESRYVDLHLGVDTSQFEPAYRNMRRTRIDALNVALEGTARGRTPAQKAVLRAGMRSGMDVEEVSDVLDSARAYDSKTPDADLIERFAAVDWDHDPTLLYVGRLISTKGIQGIVAALPLLLRDRPHLRLFIVGHGPLREALEAMLWAMQAGDMELLQLIADHGRTLEHAPQGESGGTSLTQVAYFLNDLRERGELEEYRNAGMMYVRPENVIFTGYLTHRELRYLFPCCDAAIFPSVVKEAGPLVFLEALASGSFPLGTYFGGMRESIDRAAAVLPAEAIEVMKLSADPHRTVADIVSNTPRALEMDETYKETLFDYARKNYDWSNVAAQFSEVLEGL
jgi:glycosyltransferase involved in cell wall biosynthesis